MKKRFYGGIYVCSGSLALHWYLTQKILNKYVSNMHNLNIICLKKQHCKTHSPIRWCAKHTQETKNYFSCTVSRPVSIHFQVVTDFLLKSIIKHFSVAFFRKIIHFWNKSNEKQPFFPLNYSKTNKLWEIYTLNEPYLFMMRVHGNIYMHTQLAI